MWEQLDRVLGQTMSRIIDDVANFLPGVLVALVLILATLLLAMFVRLVLVRSLRGLELDRRLDQWGLAGMMGWTATASPAQTVTRVVYWAIVVLGLLASLTALNASIPSRFALSVLKYLPNLIAALVVLAVGAVAARFLGRSVLIGAVNMQIRSARLLSLVVKWMVLIVAVAMALDHIGIGRSVLLLAFGIFFGGVVLAAALAVGLGARDAVSRAIERQISEPPRRDDKLDHI